MQGHKMEHKRKRWLATIESVECELYKWTIYSEQHRRNIQDLLDKIKIELISLSKISPIERQELYFSIDAIERELRKKVASAEDTYQLSQNFEQFSPEAVG